VKKFFKESWAVIGYMFGLVGTFVTIISVSGKITFDIKWLIIVCFLLLASVIMAVLAVRKLKKIMQNGTRFEITAYGSEKHRDIYYTDYSKNLRVGTIVAIYYSKPFSRKMGIGVVCNSSVDEYIEITVLHVEEEFIELFSQSKTNNRKVLNDMYILPNTYIDDLPIITKIITEGGIDSNGKG